MSQRTIFIYFCRLPKGSFRTKNAMALEAVVFFTTAIVYYFPPYRFAAIFRKKMASSDLGNT